MTLEVADLRKHVTSALEDPALQKLLDAAYEAETALVGAAGAASDRLGTTGGPLLMLNREASAIASVIENGTLLDSAVTTALTAEAASAQATLLVTSSAGFLVDDVLTIGSETKVVATIPGGGVSLTLTTNLASTHAIGTSVSRPSLDYLLRPSGTVLERLRTGANPRWYWQGWVDVAYTPPTDAANRDRVAIALVKLDLDHNPGMTSEDIGDWSVTYANNSVMNYGLERDAILATLLSDPVGIF